MTNEKLSPLEVSKQLKDFVLEFVKNGLDRIFIHGSFDIIESALKRLEEQDNVNQILKDCIQFVKKLPDFEVDEEGDIKGIFGAIGMRIQRQMKNKEREFLRDWILKECFPKELKALEIIKEIVKTTYGWKLEEENGKYYLITNSGSLPISKDKYDLLKEILL